jgi:hypothetical protein
MLNQIKKPEIGEFIEPEKQIRLLLAEVGEEAEDLEHCEDLEDLAAELSHHLPEGYKCADLGYGVGIWFDRETEAGILLELAADTKESEIAEAIYNACADYDEDREVGYMIQFFVDCEDFDDCEAFTIEPDTYYKDLDRWFNANDGQGWKWLAEHVSETDGGIGEVDPSGFQHMRDAQSCARSRMFGDAIQAMRDLLE